MKRIFGILSLLWLVVPIRAQAAVDYRIKNFESQITIMQNTDLHIVENIDADFLLQKHGIYRDLNLKNVRIDGVRVDTQFTVAKTGDNLRIKIGDPNRTFVGPKSYVIEYTVHDALKRFDDNDELYWNAVGSKWDTPIERAKVTVLSPNAKIFKSVCYVGVVGSNSPCEVQGDLFTAENVGIGSDLTVVIGMDKNNSLIWPIKPWWNQFLWIIKYIVAVAPAIFFGLLWFFKGRDVKYLGDNVYVPGGATRNVRLFEREHLPTQFGPIAGLTPSEVGTILDQRVDMADVVAEITEFARLKYLNIYRDKRNRPLSPDVVDYLFERTDKKDDDLRPYQKSLLKDLTSIMLFAATPDQLERVFGGGAVGMAKKATALSRMKGSFRNSLDQYKGGLYEYLDKYGYFDGRPDSIRARVFAISGLFGGVLIVFGAQLILSIFGPAFMLLFLGSSIFASIFAYFLPRRTALGHAIQRQAVGLQHYLKVGKWRYDIAEKHLFLEEILPLAIALGVVDKLASDMKDLSMERVNYMPTGMGASSLGDFRSSLTYGLAQMPKSSGGGLGFSGGFSGGGGGGGGGGSW